MTGATLEHLAPECIGNWRLVGEERKGTRRMICDRCDAAHDSTPENRLAAINENYAGIYLRRLTAEGTAKLQAGRDRERAA